MSLFIIDVESDGPAPGVYSMVCFGAIKVQRDLVNAPTFYGKTAPMERISIGQPGESFVVVKNDYIPEALAVSGITREEHEKFPFFVDTMFDFRDWIARNNEGGRPIFVSDNPAFDFQWINYYFWRCPIENPFGHSARRIGDFYAGLRQDFGAASKWKSLRVTKHTHNPVDDARGNAEALVAIADKYGIKLPGVERNATTKV
jgi:hypothetical protein